MPAQQRIGLDDQQDRFPAWQLAGQEDKEGPVTPGEGGAFPLSLQDDELLTKQCVFQYQFRFAAGQIPSRAESWGIAAVIGTRPLTQSLFGTATEGLYPALDETKEHECHGLPFQQEYGGHDSIKEHLSCRIWVRASSIHVDNPQGLLVLISGSFSGRGFSARTRVDMLVFLFTDVEGASRLWEDHMDQMAAAIARHDEILQELIENDGGRSTKQTGDGSRAVLMGGSRWSAPWKPSWRFAELAVVERRPKQKRTAAETHSVRW